MSRIPFSELFDSLTELNKEKFLSNFSSVIIANHDKFKLREYRTNYAEEAAEIHVNVLTLDQWFDSIIHSFSRQPVKLSQIVTRQVDLLSPPPGLKTAYQDGHTSEEGNAPDGMGFMTIKHSNNNALIEMRGYVINDLVKRSDGTAFDRKLDNDSILELVSQEANWLSKISIDEK